MSEWTRFLNDQEYAGAASSSDMAAAAVDADVVADLTHVAAIDLSGTDVTRFLQNQLTSDVAALTSPGAQVSGYCNPQGRLVAVLDLVRIGDRFTALCARDIEAPLTERLVKYRLRSRVDIEPGEASSVRIGLSGAGALERLRSVVDGAEPTPYAVTPFPSGWVLGLPGRQPRVVVSGPIDVIRDVWTAARDVALPVGRDAWELIDVLAGLPIVRESTIEAFVPQMVNLDQIGGVSFTKGCFPGQEIVARLHYRGALKRRMVRAYVPIDVDLNAGDAVVSADGKKVGQVVRAARASDGGRECLVVLQVDSVGEPAHVGAPGGARLEFRPLPYGGPNEAEPTS